MLGKPLGKPGAQVDLISENVNPGNTPEICGKSLMKTLVNSTTLAPLGLVVIIGKLNSTLSVNARLTARSCGSPFLAVKRTLRRTM